jgi:branched-chain amino acid transport system ATP-binding protein
MDNEILVLENIIAGYGEIEVIKGLSTSFISNEITCIIGLNGAGKSTLLKAIFGLLEHVKGKIFFCNKEVSSLSNSQRLNLGISFVPQGRSNFPAMTVYENIEMGAYLRSDHRVKEDIYDIFESFPILGEKRRELAGNLSGGQQQLLEMAMSLIMHPKLIMLDEPSLGLSPKMVNDVFAEIKRINKDGTTVIMVEQNAKQALGVSDHALVLDLGNIRFEGTGQEILNDETVKRSFLGG